MLVIFGLGILQALAGCGIGQKPFSGTFTADRHPTELLLLNLVQSENALSGFLTVVRPDGQGATKGETYPVAGSVDGQTMTITANALLFRLPITGRRQGNDLVLSLPSSTGAVQSVTLEASTQDQFNQTVAAWTPSLSEDRQRAMAAEAAQADLRGRADTLRDAIDGITADTTRLVTSVDAARRSLADEDAAMADLGAKLAEVKSLAAKRPMERYHACQTVRYSYEQTMSYVYRRTLRYHRDQFERNRQEVDGVLGRATPRIDAARGAAETLQALLVSVPPRGRLAAAPGDEVMSITAHQAQADISRGEIADLVKKHDANLVTANGLMEQGQAALDGALSLVRC